jgi:hypothetical protein
MESENMKEGPPIGRYTKCIKDFEGVFMVANGCQNYEYLQRVIVPTRDTIKPKYAGNMLCGL